MLETIGGDSGLLSRDLREEREYHRETGAGSQAAQDHNAAGGDGASTRPPSQILRGAARPECPTPTTSRGHPRGGDRKSHGEPKSHRCARLVTHRTVRRTIAARRDTGRRLQTRRVATKSAAEGGHVAGVGRSGRAEGVVGGHLGWEVRGVVLVMVGVGLRVGRGAKSEEDNRCTRSVWSHTSKSTRIGSTEADPVRRG